VGVGDGVSLTIEELAREAGTVTSTVRMYQSRGLLPPPERRGRVGYYGEGHLARLRLIAQLQDEGFSLASIKQLTDAWESGRSLDDVLGLEAQITSAWSQEAAVRLEPERYAELFGDQVVSPQNFQRAIEMELVAVEDGEILVRSPRLLEIGAELARRGVPVDEALDELAVLQDLAATIADRFTHVFERHQWARFVEAGFPASEIRTLTASLQRLGALAEGVVEVTLRQALRKKATEFFVEQARQLQKDVPVEALRALSELAEHDTQS
jgi:DNA-binding transcriptional MerR regulator